jgi:uncharacterized protein (TIGR02145 family)
VNKIYLKNSVSYNGEKYDAVLIGEQTWLNRNLNYNTNTLDSRCYNDESSKCSTYGRLYKWEAMMNLPYDYCANDPDVCKNHITAPHRGVCPEGYHIPTNADWDKLFRYVDGTIGTLSPYESPIAGRYLKADRGWNNNGNSNDTYGFSALPGGYYYYIPITSIGGYPQGFVDVGDISIWWSSSWDSGKNLYNRSISYSNENAYWDSSHNPIRVNYFSVRCLQN